MNRGRITISVFLCFLMMMFLVISGCGSSSSDAVTGGGGGGASVPTYSISGTVTGYGGYGGEAGVLITLADSSLATPDKIAGAKGVKIATPSGALATYTTLADGYYIFTGLPNGNYNVIPSKAGRIFTSVSEAVPILGKSAEHVNFDSIVGTGYSISGYVQGDVLERVSGVLMTLTSDGSPVGSTFTGTDGTYSFPGVPAGTSFTWTPTMTGYTFSPVNNSGTVPPSIPGFKFIATSVGATFAQADLVGTWAFNVLRASDDGGYGGDAGADGWTRATATINLAGEVTVTYCADSYGSCGEAVTTVWTIDPHGVITETQGGSPWTTAHYTMTANKNFIAGTTMGRDHSKQLMIVQKVITGTGYAATDLYNKDIVVHSLRVGDVPKWGYGGGHSDGTGILTPTPGGQCDPSGCGNGEGATFAVNGWGAVTMSDNPTFLGFMSDDKKTIVGTMTNSGGGGANYQLLILQITGQAYNAGPLPNSTWWNHMLVANDDSPPVPFWAHVSFDVSYGTGQMDNDSNWLASNGMADPTPASIIGSITASGNLTKSGTPYAYHGQMSHDGKFTVSTLTPDAGYYVLSVTSR